MAGVSLVTVHRAGGTIAGGVQGWFRVDGSPQSVVGDAVQSHPPCPSVRSHCAATMATGSTLQRIDGVPICRAGDTASCGHAADGLPWFRDDG